CRDLITPVHPLHRLATQQLEQARRGPALQQKLTAVLAGKATAADASERVALAHLSQQPFQRGYLASARLWQEAFEADPKLADRLRAKRYNAACAAVLAGCGQGKDAGTLGGADRAGWRRQALTWLRADLAARASQLKSWFPGQATQARQALEHWR